MRNEESSGGESLRTATIPNYEKGFNRQDAKNAKAEVFADGHHLRAATTCGLPPLAVCHQCERPSSSIPAMFYCSFNRSSFAFSSPPF